MLKIGRYGIALGPVFWFQTKVPTTVRHFLCFWFIKEARPNDVDKEQPSPVLTLMEQEGRRYRYWKASEPHRPGDTHVIGVIRRGRVVIRRGEGG